jgi:hypothetical protein
MGTSLFGSMVSNTSRYGTPLCFENHSVSSTLERLVDAVDIRARLTLPTCKSLSSVVALPDLFEKLEKAASSHQPQRVVNPSKSWGLDFYIFDDPRITKDDLSVNNHLGRLEERE